MTYLEKLITEKGPILSGDLIKVLTRGSNAISNDAARKRLSRIKGDIFRLKGLFADGQILFYNKKIYGSLEYYEGLHGALKKSGKQYNIVLKMLQFHHGQLKLTHLPSYTVNTVLKLSGHVLFDSILKKLEGLNLIHVHEEYVSLSGYISHNSNPKRAKAIEVAKNFILAQFNDWSRNIGLVSYNSSKFYSEFGKYQFNFVAPSYIGSLPSMATSKIIPAFVVADILVGNEVGVEEVEFIINKVSALKQQKRLAKFIPFIIVDSIEDTNTLHKLKANGIVLGFVNELFGDGYKELLNALINLVTNAGAILKRNPEAYLDLLTKLNKLVDGKTNNLRGDVFELAVGYYFARICRSIDIGKQINHNGEQREIDVYALFADKIVISECKGYNSRITKVEVETWLQKKVPIIHKWILDQPSLNNLTIIFEFWSTGGYDDDAKFLLDKSKNSKYKVNAYTLEDMLQKAQETKSKKFTDILKSYYLKEL